MNNPYNFSNGQSESIRKNGLIIIMLHTIFFILVAPQKHYKKPLKQIQKRLGEKRLTNYFQFAIKRWAINQRKICIYINMSKRRQRKIICMQHVNIFR